VSKTEEAQKVNNQNYKQVIAAYKEKHQQTFRICIEKGVLFILFQCSWISC